ncbi:antitoxin HipB [Streptococcus mitis]|uniref:Antitoxin HipB n=1 Tax=Streptococcus mitis TaxID=28037 RepID=A0A428HWH8_STRMT|nr:helix-turn-helix domain-containing protein [Streptococcus mitis]RSK00346.1 antitoxin HipB [Streptococcus mitis]
MLKEKYPSTEDTRLILQNNLKAIRLILNWTSSDLGNLIGVTKQTISNLENQNNRLTKLHYIALRTVIDFEIENLKTTDQDRANRAELLLNFFDESEKYAASENKSIDLEQISEVSSLIAASSTVKLAAKIMGPLAAIIGAPVVAALMNSRDKK